MKQAGDGAVLDVVEGAGLGGVVVVKARRVARHGDGGQMLHDVVGVAGGQGSGIARGGASLRPEPVLAARIIDNRWFSYIDSV